MHAKVGSQHTFKCTLCLKLYLGYLFTRVLTSWLHRHQLPDINSCTRNLGYC